MNYTYLLRCADGSLYCGWSNDLEGRIRAHNEGRGAKYTRSRRPAALAYCEMYATKEEALRREAAIKRMKKEEKEKLAAGGMKIIISPAKRMRRRTNEFPWRAYPAYLEQSEALWQILRGYDREALGRLFGANASITEENYRRYQEMDLRAGLTPALLAYVGIQYQYLAPQVFTEEEWEYACRHLRILSGFYGILRADDGVVPYRLEMQAKLATERGGDLYAYWGDLIYRELALGAPGGARILNLASKEYSRAVEPWLRGTDRMVSCVFGSLQDGKIRVKATEAKMARGEMVRFLAGRGALDFGEAKEFDRLGFCFDPSRSDPDTLVFLK